MARKRYRVTGKHKVFGVEPGEPFYQEIEPVQEARLIKSGAIARVGGRPPAKPKVATTTEARESFGREPETAADDEASASKE